MNYQGQSNFDHSRQPRIGVLLTNLGTPDEPTSSAVRRYLREFLSDTRVVELPRPLWLPILYGFILTTRPARSARLYQKIWTDKGSPLAVYTKAQCDALSQSLQKKYGENALVEYAMRYGQPSIESGLNRLIERGAEKIILLPLYPQYAGSTTGSTFDAVAAACKKLRWVPELHYINQYHDHPTYIAACAKQINNHWQQNPRAEKLLLSFHGLPKAHLLNGDPYFCHCHKTARLLAEALDLGEDDYVVTFQSRLGKQEWLKPYTDQTVEALAQQGVKSLDVFCPGFAADCLETLEEIALQNREFFQQAGGESFNYIPALNASAEHIDALQQLLTPIIDYYLPITQRDTQKTSAQYQRLS